MADAATALQMAIYDRLSAGLAPVPVYDDVPENPPHPYVTIGAGDWRQAGDKTVDGQEHRPEIHVWSRYRGRKETKDLQGRIHGLLHNRPMDLAGHRLILLRFEFAAVLEDPDGLTWHGVQRFRALTETL